MNWLRKWWIRYRENNERELAKEIRSEFDVEEKGGHLFLTHNGVAFEEIDKQLCAEKVAGLLNRARETAQKFRMP